MDKDDILKGRIYPAIKSCVNNRYKILVGYFTFYSSLLVMSSNEIINSETSTNIKLITNIIFIFIIIHNYINYLLNNWEEMKLEKRTYADICKDKTKYKIRWFINVIGSLELLFFLFCIIIIFTFWLCLKI